MGAGKGTIVEYLVKKGFKHYSVRAYLTEKLNKRNIQGNRDHLVKLANELRNRFGASYIARQLLKIAQTDGANAVIESIRNIKEAEELKKQGNFYLISVDADIKIRYRRIRKRGSVTDKISYEQFLEEEKFETTSEKSSDSNIIKVMKLADFAFINNESKTNLYKSIDGILQKIL